MAESNKWVIVISWWQLGLAGTGTLLVLGSLGLAFQSNRLTRKAVEITEETAERQLRAYVQTETGGGIISEKEGSITLRLRNVGQTPARELVSELHVHMLNSPLPKKVDFHATVTAGPNDIVETDGSIGSGIVREIVFQLPKPGLPIMAKLISSGKMEVAFFGKTSYRDVFGKQRWTRFCHIYSGADVRGAYYETGNDAS